MSGVTPSSRLDRIISSCLIYLSVERNLTPRTLEAYRGDYRSEVAFLVQNELGCFAVVGSPATPAWIEPAAAPPSIPPSEESEGDDIDFEMF